MYIRYFRYFESVARHGSIARAATALRIAQPALSRQIQDLEQEVGATLLVRGRRGIELTPAGIELRRGTAGVLERLERMVQRARLADAGALGTITVGLGRAALDSTRVGHAIASVRETYPEIELVVSEVSLTRQSDALLSGELDIALAMLPSAEDTMLHRATLFDDVISHALVSSAHPLATAKTIEPKQLADEPLLIVDGTIEIFAKLFAAVRELGISRLERHFSIESVYSMVAAGRGWTVGLRSLAGGPPPGTKMVPLSGLSVSVPMVARWRIGAESSLLLNVVATLRTSTSVPASVRPEGSGGLARRIRATDVPSDIPPGVELRHLRALITTLDEGSLSGAAQRLGLTQSGVSRQVVALERALALRLIERVAHGVRATPAGEALRADGMAVLILADEALAGARMYDRRVVEHCRMGTIPAELTNGVFLSAVKRLAESRPELNVEVEEMRSGRQISALVDRHIDVGVASGPPGAMVHPELCAAVLIDDPIDCALVATSHPLARRASIRPTELATEPLLFVSREVDPDLYDGVINALSELGCTPLIAGMSGGPRALWRLAADSSGWSLGTRSQRANPPPGLVAVPIEGLSVSYNLQLLWRKEESSRVVHAVVDAFREFGSTQALGTLLTASMVL